MGASPSESMKADLFKYGNDKAILYELMISLEPDIAVGTLASTVKLWTSDPERREIAIPITAMVEK